jgi:PAS domain S-box-containing protein
MAEFHPLLQAQIQQNLGENFQLSDPLKRLLNAINVTYQDLASDPKDSSSFLTQVQESASGPKEGIGILFETTFEGIIIHDQGIILDVNRAAFSMLGYTREEVVGRSAFTFIAKVYWQTVADNLSRHHPEPYEIELIRKDGSIIQAEICGRSYYYRGKPVRVVSFRDITSRKQYEEELHWQKTLLKKVLDTLPIFIFLKDKQGRFVFVNQFACDEFKTSADQVIGKNDYELYEDQDLASTFVNDDREVWREGKLIVREEKNEKNGETIYMLTGKTLIRRHDPASGQEARDEEEQFLLGYSLDITDRIRMEEELRAKENFIRQILDTDPNPIYVRNYEGRFLMINQALADLTSLSKEEFLMLYNDPSCLQFPPEPYAQYKVVERKVIETGERVDTEEVYTRPDGEVRYFHAIKKPLPLLAEDGNTHVLSILVDITEQKRTLEQLRTSEARYRQIVEFASDMIYQCDYMGYCTYVNPIGARILGFPDGELIGVHFTKVICTEDREMVMQFYKEQFISRTSDSYLEFKAHTKTGEVIWVGQTVHMLLKDDRILGFQAVARDITKRKLVEQELLRAKQVAEDSMKAKEQFLSVMSHELRTPLNAVIGVTHLLIEKNAETSFDPTELTEYLSAIKFSADNLMVIINDILDFSKIESGKISFEQTLFELDSIFHGIRQSFGFDAAEKNIRLLFNTEASLPKAMIGDPGRLLQIFTNLVSNALKFTSKGYVEVSAEVLTETPTTCTIQFGVADTGIGIPPDKTQLIFESFTQASTETARQYGGTGLGLSISKQLVELQGGQIQVHSTLGMGSTFTFWLTFGKTQNVMPTQTQRLVTHPITEPNRLAGSKVLLVEDNKMNQLVAGEFLRNWGLMTDIVSNGYDALEKLNQNIYDLVLMDLQMPGMDGFDTARQIRSMSQLPQRDIPILAITASLISDVRNQVLRAGMEDVITKPFNPQELHHKLLQYLYIRPATELKPEKEVSKQFSTINLEYLESASIDNVQFMEEMIRVFLRQTPEFVTKIREAGQHQEWKELSAVLHKMKATTATVGIYSLTSIFDQVGVLLQTISTSPKKRVSRPVLREIAALMEHIAETCEKAYIELEESLVMLARENSL